MASQEKSKAQRRTENQRRAAERRAAERRQKQLRTSLWVGAAVVLVAVIAVVIVVSTGGSSGVPSQFKNPRVALEPIPASMKASWVQPPAGTPGPETIPVPSGPKLASLLNAATGQTIDGVQCQAGEKKTEVHVHTHLTVFVDGKAQVIPYGIGIPGAQAVQTPQGPFVETGSCFYWLHVHAYDGIIHVESPTTTATYHLGQFFDEWGIPLSSTQVGPAKGHVTAFFTAPGEKTGIYTGNPRDLPLGDHYQIQLVVGTPIVAPVQITNWGGL